MSIYLSISPKVESSSHLLLHYKHYNGIYHIPLDTQINIIINLNDKPLVKLLNLEVQTWLFKKTVK